MQNISLSAFTFQSLPSNKMPSLRDYECEECDKVFTRRFNLIRHMEDAHPEEEPSDAEESEAEESIDNDSEKGEDESDGEEEEEEVDNTPFKDLVVQAVESLMDDIDEMADNLMEEGICDETNVQQECFPRIKPQVQKALRKNFVTYIHGMFKKKRHPLMQSILKRVVKLRRKGLSEDEAIKSAVSFRKHAIDSIIRNPYCREANNIPSSSNEV